MRWYEIALLVFGVVLVVNGLLQWFGSRRVDRDPAVVDRTRRAAAVLVGLGLAVLVAQAVLVWA